MKEKKQLWQGLAHETQPLLERKNYGHKPLSQRLVDPGVMASELIGIPDKHTQKMDFWIPGVEIFPRSVFRQFHRGTFSECARQTEVPLGKIRFWPKQWSSSRMFAGTAKGIHVHPPYVPKGKKPSVWFQSLYARQTSNLTLRPYSQEQWDVWFFLQGSLEVLLVDLRAGLPRKIMRFYVDGDDKPSVNNVGVVIPAGIGHGLRVEGSVDAILIYGTSTIFRPEFEGRIASDVETNSLPKSWQKFLRL